MDKEEVLNDLYARIQERGKVTEEDGKIIQKLRLTEFEIPEGVKKIGYKAFAACEKLREVLIPSSVIEIEDAAFLGCKSLTNITIPDSVTRIEGGAFAYCGNLTNVTIGKSVDNIGVEVYSYGSRDLISVFDGCRNLEQVIFKGKTLDEIQSMDDYPFGIENPEEVIVAEDSPRNGRQSLGESLMKKWAKRYLQSLN